MYLSKNDIQDLERIKRLNLINSVTGIKPANLIGSIDKDGRTNVAIFSSIVHLGSNPAIVGFISRPTGDEVRDTYNNIKSKGYYTINHIHSEFIANAHYTSAKFPPFESEFDKCSLTAQYLANFEAPFVKESRLKMGLKFVEEIPIKINGTVMIVGEIEHIYIPDDIVESEGYMDLAQNDSIGISGLNSYYQLVFKETHPYARIDKLPNFTIDEN